ncbi:MULTISPECIES: 3-dehydroquinate synthase [unclassified Staphylococcus]|uniref:3-dehydroquinate synthase n=1 Tax=unclassified Staphylococcus TaxID=91994 RepID=UPI0021D30ACA|nr:MULTISPECIES: 3-dehydroquinate synthase [unclassified Staphylococcus]UXR79252.1 3-dehydroquinate synthase [Staphylococcus sp. IVB6227]UXR83469.1 3-dehydroquinate synthase [Staphylococcus sp. IVB6214]
MEFTTTYVSQNYPVVVSHQAIQRLMQYTDDYQHVFVFVDEHVSAHWSSKIQAVTESRVDRTFILPAGEQVKTFEHFQSYLEQLLSFQPSRNTCLIAIGGGAVGDFVGFLAATLLRGVDFIQVPTTILAHDSSIGGKVGINATQGKNLVGAFHRPAAVLYDLDFLTTLPPDEVLSGYGEVYKHGLLNGASSIKALESSYNNRASLLKLINMEQYLMEGIQTKLNIVVNDEKERGQRQWLNLGHTFGHAVEYATKIPHGHAVMIGILYQMIVSNQMLGSSHQVQHYYDYFQALGYPLHLIDTLTFEPLLQLMKQDKKNNQSGIRMVLLKNIGEPTVETVEIEILQQAFNRLKLLRKESSENDNID